MNQKVSHLVQLRKPLQPRRGLVLIRPVPEQLGALLLDIGITQVARATDTQALQQHLVGGDGPLEARAGILDEAVEDGQGAQLAVGAAVLELLADGARGFSGARGLQLDDLDQVGQATEVVFLVGFAGKLLDGDGDGRVRLLLGWGLVS